MKHRGQLSVAVVGAGAVGTAFALTLRAKGYRVTAVVSRTPASARRLARVVGCRTHGTSLSIIPGDSHLVVIAVPDRSLPGVGIRLLSVRWLRKGVHVIHTSGSLGSDILEPLTSRGCRVAAVHPIQTFPKRAASRERLASMEGIYFGIEAPRGEERWAAQLVRTMGGIPLRVPKQAKIAYHLACTFAANYPVVLLGIAERMLRTAGIKGGLAPLAPLIRTSIENTIRRTSRAALTGPVARGDLAVLRRHRAELGRSAPELVPLFRLLVAEAVRFAEPAGARSAPRAVRAERRHPGNRGGRGASEQLFLEV